MIKLMKYLKKSAGYIVLIIALLFLQAYCDLSLPDYTSKIINVGIQQKGIEDSVPDKLRDSTLQNLQIFMDEDQKKEVSQNYTQEDDTWVLNDDISKETRENLNEDFSKARMMVAAVAEDSEQGQAMAAQMGLPEGTDPLTALAQMPEEAVQQIMSQVDEKLKDMPESIVTQAGVSLPSAVGALWHNVSGAVVASFFQKLRGNGEKKTFFEVLEENAAAKKHAANASHKAAA